MRGNWSKQKLGDVITLEYGKPLPKEQRCDENEGFPAYGANGIKCYAREPYWQHSSIIVGRKGTAGAVNLVDGGFWPLDVTYYVTFDDQKHDLKFLYHMLSGLNLPALATGVKPGINRNLVYAIEQYFPPLPEQKRIVAILDEAFAGIDTAIANTEKNLANARELFESYLTLLMGRGGENLENVTLGDTCDFFNGKAHEKIIDENGAVILVNSKFVSTMGKKFKCTSESLFPLFRGDIAMVMSDVPKGKALAKCFLVDRDGAYSLNQRICCIRSDFFDNKFLFYQLDRHPYLLSFDNEGNQTNLRKGDILKCPLWLPSLDKQKNIASLLDSLSIDTQRLDSIYRQKLTALAELKQSLLQKAFSGELTAGNVAPITSAKTPSAPPTTDSPAFAAHVMAVAYHWHESRGKHKTFGHVKAQKTLHLVEALAQIDLGRAPIKDAAGPNDFAHMRTAEQWARENDYYDFVQRLEGQRGYDFVKGARYSEWLARALDAVEPYKSALDRVVNLLMPLDTQKAELVATVYAAWNNLLLDGHKPTEADIVYEARDNWHPDKQQYSQEQFREAIDRLRSQGMVPTGAGKRVTGQESFEL